MSSIKYSKIKAICIALCFMALVGFFLPAINLRMNFLDNQKSISFSTLSLLDKPESIFDGANLSQEDMFSISSESMFSDLFMEIRPKLIISIGAYFIALILLIVIIASMFVGKLKKPINVMLVLSLALLVYAGCTILSVTEALFHRLENSLGFLASFINLSDLVKINLGSGYWLTLIMLGCMLLTKIIFYFLSDYRKETED